MRGGRSRGLICRLIIRDKKPVRLRKMAPRMMAEAPRRCYVAPMALVLVMGLVNMMRGGSPNTSQRLMRLRVLLQFVAICITMFALWVMGR